MTSLLDGLTIGVAGRDRPLHVAARCLSDLGATVRSLAQAPAADVDCAWLGAYASIGEGDRLDVLLRGPAESGTAAARSVVTYRPVSSTAAHAGQPLDERQLGAVGGMAIAVGEPDRPPLPLPEGAVDALIGTHLAGAALAALLDDIAETEVAGADVVAWAVATNLHLYRPYGLPWYRAGRRASGSGTCYPYGLFEASDGLFCMIGRTDRDWQALRAAMGDPDWARSERFSDPRVVGRRYPEEADAHVAPWAARHTRAELMAILTEHDVPGAPVLEPAEVLALPALEGRWGTISDGDVEVRVPGRPFDQVLASGTADHGPLAGATVLDLSWVWSGPAVSVGLAELGADVIKVESATRPDNARLRGRPDTGVRGEHAPERELAPYFHALNRGKRSISLDLRTAAGRAVLLELAKRADVIVENLSAGVMTRFGIPPERVLEANPSCVFLSMRGYRGHPTTEGLRAYAPVLSSSAGLETLVAYPGEPPVGAMTVAFSDAFAASQGLLLALAGLQQRSALASGSAITLSQHEAAVLANGHNLVAEQVERRTSDLEPFERDAALVTAGEAPAGSPWTSPDLFAEIQPRYLSPLSVARLPWRAAGELPRTGAAAPLLGEHTAEILRSLLAIDDGERARLARVGALR
jgi:crotonobetainyl-CoA:carnitine CoA-transferase CaiB-like acyl-CoA transferase